MKVFVTGKNGFIAINLIDRLKRDGHIVEASSQDDSVVDKLREFKPDHIHHLAVEAYHPDKMVDSNILLTHTILEYCRFNPVIKLVIYGSSSEYGRKSLPMKETDVLEPETIYEGTKAAASLLARAYAFTYGIPTVIIRPMSVYGPHEKPHKIITRILTENLEFLSPTPCHDWIYIDDFIEAVICIVGHPFNLPFDIVNIGTGIQRPNIDIHRIAETITGKTIEYKEVSNARGVGIDSKTWVCDPTRLKTVYGFVPKITLEEGMERFFMKSFISPQT
jgi:nucleoside-diphosphate-sugar epimerase